MKEFRNKLIVHGLMKINDKYLVIKRSIIKRGKPNVYPEYWDIPGGSVEDFETPGEALIREVKEENKYYMYKYIKYPGVLIEAGFISNPDENYLLRQEEYQNKLITLIADAIEKYYQK